tara:strand:- start:1514 stop:1984 length:471 start_codon:yes stop_codon:yes gene_type:complete
MFRNEFYKEIFNMKFIIKIIASLMLLSITSLSYGATETIEMLNKLGKESMVYSKKVVKIDVGETILWKATTKGHNVEFIKGGTPEGVEKFKSKMNKDVEYTFQIPGIYAYWCTPHKSMGMIGFVIVGNDKSNIDKIRTLKFFGKSKKIAPDLINSL